MRGSRNLCQAGGGGVEARRPENSLVNVFFSHQLILQLTEGIQWFYYRGEEGVQLLPGGGGVQRNNITCDFPGGGGGPPNPPLDPHVGRLTPLFAYRVRVYQNLNKSKKTTMSGLFFVRLTPPPLTKILDPGFESKVYTG